MSARIAPASNATTATRMMASAIPLTTAVSYSFVRRTGIARLRMRVVSLHVGFRAGCVLRFVRIDELGGGLSG